MASPERSTPAAGTPPVEPRTLADARKKLAEAGYAKVKSGSLTVPNYTRIETWMGHAGVVYLAYNELTWDLLTRPFGRNPASVDGLSEVLLRLAA